MKQNGLEKKRSVSTSSSSRSSLTSGSDIASVGSGQLTRAFGAPLGKGGSLALALQANRRNKPKTSFLGNKSTSTSAKDSGSSSMGKFIARGSHVLFHTAASVEGHSSLSNLSKASSFGNKQPSCDRHNASKAGKRKRNGVATSSLWNKVSTNSFRKRI